MKKILLAFGTILVIAIIFIMSFGVQIGNVRIGKQNDTLAIKQDYDLVNSPFNSEYLESDKIICVNLWATWCKPCVAEMPMLNTVKEEYKDENIEFLSLSVDTDSIKLGNFIKKEKFNFKDITLENLKYKTAILNYLSEKPADNKINSYSVPVTYLIKNKKVVKTLDGGIENKEELTNAINLVMK